MLTSWARRTEDLTFDKTDEKDAVLIARLTAQLRCYVPEPVDETWGRLRHLGTRREQLITETGQSGAADARPTRMRLAGRAGLRPAAVSLHTWIAALTVIADRDGGDLARTRRLGAARFEHAVRRQILKQGRQKPCLRIVRNMFTALDRPGRSHRAPGRRDGTGALLLEDWAHAHPRLTDTETRMVAVLDELQLTELVTSITGHLRGRRRGDPGPDGRPAPLRHRPCAGQTRRTRPAGETVRHVRRPHQTHRPGPPRTTRWRPGARSGERNAPTPSTAPDTRI